MLSSFTTVGAYVADIRTAEYDRWVEAHQTYVHALRVAPHMPGTQEARVTAEVLFADAVRASYEYMGQPVPADVRDRLTEVAAGLVPYPVP